MDDWQDDVTLVGFVDDVENAKFYAEKHKLSAQVTEGLNTVHGALIDLEPLMHSGQSIETLTQLMGSSIDDLNGSCIAGNEPVVQNRIGAALAAIQSVEAALKP